MVQKLFPLTIVILNFCGLQMSEAITCFSCTNNKDLDPYLPFDADCGLYNYNNTDLIESSYVSNRETCRTVIYENGYVSRSLNPGTWAYDDLCSYYREDYGNEVAHQDCFCSDYLCNTGGFCDHCTTTTKPSPQPTTEISTTTEKPITEGLQCFSCIDCQSVDDDTAVIEDERYLSCVTTIFLDSLQVIRSGAFEEHQDGQCVQQNENTLFCWCTSDKCNDKTFGY